MNTLCEENVYNARGKRKVVKPLYSVVTQSGMHKKNLVICLNVRLKGKLSWTWVQITGHSS